ncbi:DUF2537 domain-containing protein [Gordonia insulae]|uniref:DUF2537 domain-containing protein n=1 Tax=Gordonia insulae TaxID=2420509 RepID=A0A3G8JLC3_9ACTN|nr:DUF2537 domain-containing protein [Gordonia insulae]AZG45372.1 hypothetical protein D7316_01968 [Gordonia insulae]
MITGGRGAGRQLFPRATDDDRAVAEPTPWVLGLLVTVCFAVFTTCLLVGVYELIGGVVRWLGVAAVLVVAVGLGWTLWDLRDRPVWRWIVWGSIIGLLAGLGSSIALLALGR